MAPTAIGNLSGLGEFTTTPGANFAGTFIRTMASLFNFIKVFLSYLQLLSPD